MQVILKIFGFQKVIEIECLYSELAVHLHEDLGLRKFLEYYDTTLEMAHVKIAYFELQPKITSPFPLYKFKELR